MKRVSQKKLVYGQCQECGVDATDSNGVWGLEFFDEVHQQYDVASMGEN